MTVHQLSVFIENKSGALVRVLRLLKQENIQLIASTIADTADFGIFRIICSEPEKACNVLKEAGVAVSLCEVFAVELDDRPGPSSSARTMPKRPRRSSPPTASASSKRRTSPACCSISLNIKSIRQPERLAYSMWATRIDAPAGCSAKTSRKA